MTFPVSIEGKENLVTAKVTDNGELVVAALEYSMPYFVKITVANEIYNVVPARTGKKFISTGMFVSTSKSITGEKTVEVYESLAEDSGVHATDIFSADMIKNERVVIPLRNAATEENKYINANCDDADVSITIWGYYVNA
jgi:hypothetical protein